MATTYTRRTYTQSEKSKQARVDLDDHLAAQPLGYNSQWLSQLDNLANQILNRQAFSYDLASDPLYRQYMDSYVNLGTRAMQDTMGQAAALTGGYGSSYGITAGQQAYNGYLQQMQNLIPELYQLALDSYDRQGRLLTDQYGLVSGREALDYGRYQDGLANWADTRDYLTGRLDAERNFDYTQFRDDTADDQWQAAFDEDIRRFDFQHGLGEFAGASSGGQSSGGTRKKTKEEEEEERLKAQTNRYPDRISQPNRVNPGLKDESY